MIRKNYRSRPSPTSTAPCPRCMKGPAQICVVNLRQETPPTSSVIRNVFFEESRLDLQPNLKPIGLGVMLNTHCLVPGHGRDFSAHLAAIDGECKGTHVSHFQLSSTRSATAAQVCMCRVAHCIGFSTSAFAHFSLSSRFAIFDPEEFKRQCANRRDEEERRHTRPSIVSASELTSKDLIAAGHVPIPHMMSTLVRDKRSRTALLLASGSPSMVLQHCTLFWNGKEVLDLTEEEKDKCMKFYQHHSDDAAVYALSYRPVPPQGVLVGKFSTKYMQASALFRHKDVPSSSLMHRAETTSEASDRSSTFASGDPIKQARASVIAKLKMRKEKSAPARTATFATPTAKTSIDSNASAHSISRSTLVRRATMADTVTAQQQMLPRFSNQRHLHNLHQDQIFLGMIVMRDTVAPDIQKMIQDLDQAGIRFVHFSQENEVRSKVFAEAMGLETGWNCFISLADDGYVRVHVHMHTWPQTNICKLTRTHVHTHTCSRAHTHTWFMCIAPFIVSCSPVYHDNRARLPRGINAIRPHIDEVDNVPLLVPLFSECSPAGISEMIDIYHENDMVVACLGSSLNPSHISCYAHSDVSIAIDPERTFACTWPLSRLPCDMSHSPRTQSRRIQPMSAEAFASDLQTLPCSLRMARDSPISVTNLIAEARRLTFNMRQSFVVLLMSTLTLTAALVLSHLSQLPPVFSPLQVMWFVLVILPLMSISFLQSRPEKRLMRLYTGPLFAYRMDMPRFLRYYIIRWLPSAVVCVLAFAAILHALCERDAGSCNVLAQPSNTSTHTAHTRHTWHGWATDRYQGLALAQGLAGWLFVVYVAFVSVGSHHRTLPLWKFSPLKNWLWFATIGAAVGLQSAFVAVHVAVATNGAGIAPYSIANIPGTTVALCLLWVAVIIVLNELVKLLEHGREETMQKRAALLHGTRLGMHSPK
ncbi:hypothetical protein PTSG_07781 [Salpingoeca rosetta]|uniref:Cation-transporting P-type ATPase C-terminal domain-containing protein n=1 Tax=Salpingoeca rosetta (strain ATCC 50818 / BSB-021) TaxID=946362 RepID=F2UGB2_SALR5|nr:uncharacterized protein PTSG_07781 [Salpingoeca rosetta]EGD75662.1 hypothetical protein PTSG_07781 [Salpingoeca rosetta]|eukprot:XP_004991583.1 hypothetical protein PTSG_07781 [Salpingoeca rosetta]